MNKVSGILLVGFSICFLAISNIVKADTKPIRLTKYFFGETIGLPNCIKGPVPKTAYRKKSPTFQSSQEAQRFISSVVGFDWEKEHQATSNSLTVKHEKISKPIKELFALVHSAVSKNDTLLIEKSKKLVIDIALANTIMNTPSIRDIKSNCYDGRNNINAKCLAHEPQFAMQFGANYTVAASMLRNHMSDEEKAITSGYIEKLYQKFSKPHFENDRNFGKFFQQMANGGIAVLAYGYWKNDTDLILQTFDLIFANIDQVFLNDGYIKGTSFRGVRGFWYHSYGTNSALATIALADLWNVDVPDAVRAKVKKAATLLNLGVKSIDKFYSRPSPDGRQYNATYDEKYARHHLHQMAISIALLSKMAVGVEVQIENDKVYLSKSITEFPSDFTVGFNPFCMAGGYKKYYSDKQKNSLAAIYSEMWYPKPLTIVDEKKYDRTAVGMQMRFKCLADYAASNNITGLPSNQEIESLITNIEGNHYYRSHRQIVKAGVSKEAMNANKKALVRLVNFEGTNEEYCAKPVL